MAIANIFIMIIIDDQFRGLVKEAVYDAISQIFKEKKSLLSDGALPEEARFLTRRQTANYMGIGLSTVDCWARIGRLKKHYIDNVPRFDRFEIDAVILKRNKGRVAA